MPEKTEEKYFLITLDAADALQVLAEVVDLIDGRYCGIKDFYETPSDQRTGTDREAFLMYEEVKVIKDCLDIVLEHAGINRDMLEAVLRQRGRE